MPSPVSLIHSDIHARMVGFLMQYRATTPRVRVLDNATVILDRENEVQPDTELCITKGGQTHQTGDYLYGAPELVVEVAHSSASYDLHEKLRVYRRSGVQEYVVLMTLEQQTVWYRLNEGRYDEAAPDANGVIHSQVFPGLRFHSGRFWADDVAGLLAALQEGLGSPEHTAFVAALSAAASE